MMICRYCNEKMKYVGIQDGGGDYGGAICDEYECPLCGWVDETDCFEIEEDNFE